MKLTKSASWRILIVSALLFTAIVASMILGSAKNSDPKAVAEKTNSSIESPDPTQIAFAFQEALKKVYKDADYLVRLQLITKQRTTDNVGEGQMAGFLIKRHGQYLVITAAHVYDESKKVESVYAYFKGNPRLYIAEFDKVNRRLDCATVKIRSTKFDYKGKLPVFAEKVEIGDIVLALGSPLQTDFSLSFGIIQNVNFTIPETWNPRWHSIMLLHSAGLAPGSSGGLLLNLKGEIAGINVGIPHSQYTNFCVAVRIEDVLKWIDKEYAP